MPADQKLKVLYLAGSGRSGSTLIEIILGQVPGCCPVGEVRDVWDYGLRDNRPCGCGMPVRDCPTWKKVFTKMESKGSFDPEKMTYWRERYARTKRLVPIFLKGKRYAKGKNVEEYLRVTENMYHALANTTNSNVIIDSSKWPAYGFLLSNIKSIDLYILHLVRDPRACAFSWKRKKEIYPEKYLAIQSPLFTTSYWAVWNPAIRSLFCDKTDRYMFMRYEDFVQAPRTKIGEVLKFIGVDETSNPFVSEDRVPVSPTHTIEGNVTRFQSGEIQVRADSEWQDKMPWGSKALVTAMTWPMLIRYGYWLGRSE